MQTHYLNIISWQKTNSRIEFTFVPIFIDFASDVNDVAFFETQFSAQYKIR